MNDSVKTAIDSLAADWGRFTRQHAARQDETDRRLAEIEANVSRAKSMGLSGGTAAPTGTRDEREHKERFTAWLRKPHDHATRRELAEAESELSKKSVSVGSDAGGGFAVPHEISREVARRVADLSPLRRLCRVERVGSSDFSALLDTGGTATAWAGESDARNETATPKLAERRPTFGTLYAYPKATEESLQDIFFNVGEWLTQSIAEGMASAEAVAFISGNGTNRPSGLLNTAPAATADNVSPARNASALQFLPTGNASGFPPLSATSPVSYPADLLVDLVHSIAPQYLTPQNNPAWVMSRSTASVLRRFKDLDANYLWQPSMAAGQPPTLLGFPVYLDDHWPAIGTNACPVGFGGWRAAYLIADRSELRITLDEVTAPGFVKWHVRKRVGGIVLDNAAVKVLKCSTT